MTEKSSSASFRVLSVDEISLLDERDMAHSESDSLRTGGGETTGRALGCSTMNPFELAAGDGYGDISN